MTYQIAKSEKSNQRKYHQQSERMGYSYYLQEIEHAGIPRLFSSIKVLG